MEVKTLNEYPTVQCESCRPLAFRPENGQALRYSTINQERRENEVPTRPDMVRDSSGGLEPTYKQTGWCHRIIFLFPAPNQGC